MVVHDAIVNITLQHRLHVVKAMLFWKNLEKPGFSSKMWYILC